MDILIKVVQLLASLSLLVVIHEFGHFMFAKLFKCRVEKFYLFFDYKFSLLKWKRGETEFGIGWIPFGGYVKIAGMIDESMDKEQMAKTPEPWEYRSKPAWQRFFIIIGGVMMNIILAMAIYIGVTFAWGEQYIQTSDVPQGFSYSQTAQHMGFQNGDIPLTVDGDSVDNFLKLPQDILLGTQRAITVNRGGEKHTFTIADSLMGALAKDRGFISLRVPYIIATVEEGTPAEEAYLKQGDQLISVDSVPMVYLDEFKTAFTSAKDSITLGVKRGADTLYQTVLIAANGQLGTMIDVQAAHLDTVYPVTEKSYTLIEAVPAGINRAGEQIGNYIKQLKVIFNPETETYKEVGGFIAMGKIFPATWSWYAFWNITALLSIMLAVLNILPIPALDGGHLMFIIYEMVTRKTPSQRFMEIAQYVGFILILALILFANGNDILKLFIGK